MYSYKSVTYILLTFQIVLIINKKLNFSVFKILSTFHKYPNIAVSLSVVHE